MRLILWLIIITIFSTFLVGIIPSDYLYISDKNYLLSGIGIILIVICVNYIFSKKVLTIYVLRWELLIVIFGIYLFLRHENLPTISFYNSNATFYVLLTLVYFIGKQSISANPFLISDLAIGICTLTFFQIVYGYLQLFNVLPTNIGAYRLEGTLLNPGIYANFISLGILVCVGSYWFLNVGRLNSLFIIITVTLGIAILFFTNSRTAWIAILAGLFYMTYYRFNLKTKFLLWTNAPLRRRLVPLTIVLMCVLIGWFLYNYKIDSSNGRILIWKICLQLLKKNPVWGVGTNCFASQFSYAQMEYLRNPAIDFSTKMLADRVISAFNEYLQLTVELGFIGLILFLLLVLLPIGKFYSNNNRKEMYPFKAVVLAALIMALFSYPFHNVTIIMVFISIAAINSYKKQKAIILLPGMYTRKISLVCLLVLSIFTVYKSLNYYTFCRKWKTINISQNNQINKKITLSKYEALYPCLNKNFDFLYNYASILKFYGECEKAIECYKKSSTYYIDQNLLIDMAGCYYDLGKYDKAEKYCKDAIDLIPCLFIPKYRLFLLYQKTNRPNLALKVAEEIYDMPIKVYSETVKEIKLNVKEYIDKPKKPNYEEITYRNFGN